MKTFKLSIIICFAFCLILTACKEQVKPVVPPPTDNTEAFEALQSENSELKTAIKNLENRISELEGLVAIYSSKGDAAESARNALTGTYEKQLAELRGNYSALQKQVTERDNTIKTLNSQIAAKDKSNSEFLSQINNLEAKNADLQHKNENLQAQLTAIRLAIQGQ